MDLSCEFIDDYNHLDKNLEYVLENILSEKVLENVGECDESKELNEHFNTILLNKCECNNVLKEQCFKCNHGSNYVFDQNYQEHVLNDFRNITDLIYECSHLCTCKPEMCQNRLVQYGPRRFLKIVYSAKYCSNGLITTRDIPKGAFICEYAGELLTRREAKNIIEQNEIKNKMNYVLFLKESCLSPEIGTNLLAIVNPSVKGNIGRYLNHSCEPNCHIVSVRIDCPLPKIGKIYFEYRFNEQSISQILFSIFLETFHRGWGRNLFSL